GQTRDGPQDAAQPDDGSLRDRASEEEEEQMTRSIRKGPFVQDSLKKKIEQLNARNEKKVVKTWSRASLVLPTMVGHTIAVHDGRRHVPVVITDNMIVSLLSASAPTRTARSHGRAAAPEPVRTGKA